MNEPVDKELIGRIRQVFDQFEDATADAGWQELRRNFPKRKRKPLILWLGSAAAILLILTGIWIKNQPEEQALVLKPVLESTDRAKLPDTLSGVENENVRSEKQETDGETVTISKDDPGNLRTTEDGPGDLKKKDAWRINDRQSVQVIAKREPIYSVPLSEAMVGNTIGLANDRQLPQNIMAEQSSESKLPLVIKTPETQTLPARQSNETPIYASRADAEKENTLEEPETSKARRQIFAFSLVAGSYFNFSEGSENQLNFGAGLLSDIRLSKNLKLSTGLALASNTLKYTEGNDVPETASSSFESSKAITIVGSLKTITSMNASLLALDIPLNIKYQFIPESDQFYLSAGISSGTYLSESYNYQYRNFNMATGAYINQGRDQKQKQQLNTFELGKTLNLSLGLSSGFGKTQTLSIEPFLKYPLSGLGSENIRFGATGINLKLRFKTLNNNR